MNDRKWLYSLMIRSWILWKDRCDVVFHGVSLNPHTFVHIIHYHLASYLHDNDSSEHYSNNIGSISRWVALSEGVFKLNIDANFDSDTNQYDAGIVLRDYTGTCLGIKGIYGNGALSAENGECMAVQEALS